MEFPTELTLLLAPAGVALVFGYLQAFLLEHVTLFQNLDALAKRAVLVVLSVVLNAGAYAILEYVPGEVLADLQPWYLVIITAISLVAAEYTHAKVNKKTTKI